MTDALRQAELLETEAPAEALKWREDVPRVGGAMLPSESGEVIALLRLAVERGVPVEALEKLVALQERYQDRQAKMEFAGALAEFQRECPPIPKESTAKIVSKKTGTTFSYTYAELDTIADAVRPYLHARGLSYSWDSEVGESLLHCTCTLRHRNGHSITAKFTAPIGATERMSAAQEHAAALSYARRQSLVQVLGLTTTEPDPDGDVEHQGTIDSGQAATLQALIDEVGADKSKFLAWLRVDSIAAIRVAQYQQAIKALEAKRRT